MPVRCCRAPPILGRPQPFLTTTTVPSPPLGQLTHTLRVLHIFYEYGKNNHFIHALLNRSILPQPLRPKHLVAVFNIYAVKAEDLLLGKD